MAGARVWLQATVVLWVLVFSCIAKKNETASESKTSSSAGQICYQLTWPGDTNKTSCEDRIQPCFNPMVYSNPSTRPPNMTQLHGRGEVYCYDHCIRWSWYDVRDKLHNFTLFCGKAIDVTNVNSTGPSAFKEEGCVKHRYDTFTNKVCYCRRDRCNGATQGPHPPPGWLLLIAGAILFFVRGSF